MMLKMNFQIFESTYVQLYAGPNVSNMYFPNRNSSPRDLYKTTLLVAKALPKVLEKIYCTHQSLNLPVIVMFYTLSLGIQVQCPMKMLEQTQV